MSGAHELRLLARASLSSLVGTAVEAGVYYLTLWVGGFAAGLYRPASLAGAVGGAVANFLTYRYWVFRRTGKPLAAQAAQYAVSSALTWLAVVGALAVEVELLHLPQAVAYPPAKVFAWLVVSYPMARWVVFGSEGHP